ncbi:MAG: hypothetical protein NTZ46_01780 [Verrucomicrobia bacterium]|nr:hypothetical protein [Verrucomicrobiota bacterium]
MKHPNMRIAHLKEMIALEEKRATLLTQIDVVNERLSTIQSELYGAGLPRIAKEKRVAKSKGRKGRGELKGQILEILNAAGKTGATVKELAERIGIKAANIHSWFSVNLGKIAGLKKIGKARYAINGAAATAFQASQKSGKKIQAPQKSQGGEGSGKGSKISETGQSR